MSFSVVAIASPVIAAPSKVEVRRFQDSGIKGLWDVCGMPMSLFGRLAIDFRPVSPSRSSPAASATTQRKRNSNVVDVGDDSDDDGDEIEFPNMQAWMAHKPSGFGLAEYDTSLEERLLKEIEADRIAQAALKAAKVLKVVKKKPTKSIAPPPDGVEVYVGNLPNKRNVDRDLRAAFKSAHGLLHIRPIVKGNERTREPECKGLAFLTFASENDALDFIESYNGTNVKFGKTDKKLACELAARSSPFKVPVASKKGTGVPRLSLREKSGNEVSPSESSSPFSTVELTDVRNGRARAFVSSLNSLEGQFADSNSLEVSEDDLFALEQEIWADLEDEDDHEIDRELGEVNSSSREKRSPNDDGARSSQDLNLHVPYRQSAQNVLKEYEFDNDELGLEDPRIRRGFREAHFKSDTDSTEKDNKIQIVDSESKLLRLHLRRKAKEANSMVAGKSEDVSKLREATIENLEKRVYEKSRAARTARLPNTGKDSNKNRGGKEVSASNMLKSSKASVPLKEDPTRAIRKLGAASRLRRRERVIYSEVISKYAASPEGSAV